MKTKFAPLLACGFVCWTAITACAAFPDQWQTLQVNTNDFGLSDVVYGKGRFVAYGWWSDWGGIVSSEDGTDWTVRVSTKPGTPQGQTLSWGVRLVFTGGTFFALGNMGTYGISSDGTNWTVVGSHESGLLNSSLVAVAPGFVALGSDVIDTNIFTGNGWTWQPRARLPVKDLAYGAGLYVGICQTGSIFTSTSGRLWAQQSFPQGAREITFCGGRFIVPLGAGTNAVSTDGTNWVALNTGLTNAITRPIYANSVWMACTFNDYVNPLYLASSADGTNWFQYPPPLPQSGSAQFSSSLATDGTHLVTVGSRYEGGVFDFSGLVYVTDLLGRIGIDNRLPPRITLSGPIGRSFRIEYTDALTNPNWQELTTLSLPANPFDWTDLAANGSPQRFYRAALVP